MCMKPACIKGKLPTKVPFSYFTKLLCVCDMYLRRTVVVLTDKELRRAVLACGCY
jgi:hypothetical protein